MRSIACRVLFLCALLLCRPIFASSSRTNILQRGTAVTLQFAETISSATVRKNDRLDFIVSKDVMLKGAAAIPAGTLAQGSVIEVKRKRPLGMGGEIIIKVGSVVLTTGQRIELVARNDFKGQSHTIRMAVEMALGAAVYMPVAPVFLLSRGRDRTVLKGTEVTAFTNKDFPIEVPDIPAARESDSELTAIMKVLPPRSLNGQGREGDMLNLMFQATEDNLREAFAVAGWVQVDRSIPSVVWHLLSQRDRDTKLPMARLYVFGRRPDFSYALPDPQAIVERRHHLRIWKTDRVVDGIPVWVGAATHDVAIEFVKRKFQLSHRIDPDVDAERDFIAHDLAQTGKLTGDEYMNCPEPVFRAQTATGQTYQSDGRILFLHLGEGSTPTQEPVEIADKP
jgi:hypothetical protein